MQRSYNEMELNDQQFEPDLLHGRHCTDNECDSGIAVRVGMERADAMNTVQDTEKVLASNFAHHGDSVVSSMLSIKQSNLLDVGVLNRHLKSASNCRRIMKRLVSEAIVLNDREKVTSRGVYLHPLE